MKVLDHGEVRLTNIACQHISMSFDRAPTNAARLSFDAAGTRSEEEDIKLSTYLMELFDQYRRRV